MTTATRTHQLIAPHLAERPDAVAVIDCDGRSVTWAAYDAMISEAAEMLARHGTRPGDRVLIVAENCLATAALIFACSRLDAWAVPVNARMAAAEIARVTDHADPRVVVHTSHVSKEAAAHAATARAQAIETAVGTLHLAPRDAAPGEPALPDAGQVAVVLYTTGTTGEPKGVMLTHANLLYAARASAELRGLHAGDRVYGALPLTHVFGLASMLMAQARVGATVQLASRFSPAALHAALLEGVTVLPAVPQMHALLMAHAAEHGHDRLEGAKLRYVSSGAAPLDPTWKRKAETFYGIALQNGYGMTETTAGVSGTRNGKGDPDISVGPALPETRLAIDESVGNEPGTGEVLAKGPQIMAGYFRNPQATAAAMTAEGFLRTGDLGRIDAEGRLHIVGRSKELIIRGGFNVYPPEVEAALNDHPAVVQSAVIGRARAGNEDILAFVQLVRPDAVDRDALRAFVAERLSAYKRPTCIVLCDGLPATATGKILKHRLLAHFAAELDAFETEKG